MCIDTMILCDLTLVVICVVTFAKKKPLLSSSSKFLNDWSVCLLVCLPASLVCLVYLSVSNYIEIFLSIQRV